MNDRIHAIRVIAQRRIFEALITPGYYVLLTVGLILAYFLITLFPGVVDSSGINYALHPLYDQIARTVEGGFGEAFLGQLFAEGPFVLALYLAIVPVFLFLAAHTIFRFTLERGVGAVELVVYGPADGSSYFLAAFLKDLLLGLIAVFLALLFFLLAAKANNLFLGPMVLQSALVVIPTMTAFFAYAVLAAVLTDNAAGSIAVFVAVHAVFLLLLTASYTVVEGYARNLAAALSWILKWISPLFYWSLGVRSIGYGQVSLFLLSVLAQFALAALLLYISSAILKKRGVRP
jgi:hypothetical protein